MKVDFYTYMSFLIIGVILVSMIAWIEGKTSDCEAKACERGKPMYDVRTLKCICVEVPK